MTRLACRRKLVELVAALLTAGLPAPAADAPDKPPTHPNSEAPGSWFWPMQLNLPDNLKEKWKPRKPGDMPILAWAPPDCKRIRAVILISPNTDSMALGAHKAVRAMCAKREIGQVYLRYLYDLASLPAILERIADKYGIPEFKHAPWIPQGKSSAGMFPIGIAWAYPDRVVAGISWHAEVPKWPIPATAKLNGQTLGWINLNGEIEWGGTWYRHVRPGLLNYREHQGWFPNTVVSHGIGHGDYPDPGAGKIDPAVTMEKSRVWDYTALWLDRIIEARLPKGEYPTTKALDLRRINDADGYYIDARAIEELFQTPYHMLVRGEKGYQMNVHNARSPNKEESEADYEEYYRKCNPREKDEEVKKAVAEMFKLEKPKGLKASQLIKKAAEVPEADRKKMFWVPDRDVAEAWFKLHAIQGQAFDVP